VFVSETSGSHSYIIPTLIGAAVAYAVSGEASVSGDQRLHQEARVSELGGFKAGEAMQKQVVSVQASSTLRAFADSVAARHRHAVFPVYDGPRMVGAIPVWALSRVPAEQWDATHVGEVAERDLTWITPDTDLNEALRLLTRENAAQILLVRSASDVDGEEIAGILTKTDILRKLANGTVATSRAAISGH
jgi:CIC family chloride channel protein